MRSVKEGIIHDFFLGMLTKKGNKLVANKILYSALKKTSDVSSQSVFNILNRIYLKLETFVEIRKIRRSRQLTLVPTPVRGRRRFYLVVKFLMDSAREDKRKIPFHLKLADEMISTLMKGTSKSIGRKRHIVDQSLQNRSNIHFRW
jgi:small subunit ribosomal protein S7